MATMFLQIFLKQNSLCSRHLEWKISPQTVKVWQSYQQLKTGYYNGKCQTTLIIGIATCAAYKRKKEKLSAEIVRVATR